MVQATREFIRRFSIMPWKVSRPWQRKSRKAAAAIDFDSSYCLPPAFDVGTFLAQYQNQLFPHPGVLQKASEEIILNTYLDHAERISEDFLRQVELFRARTNLCIASYLIYPGLGHTENLWRVLVEAEKAMAQFTGWENQGGQASGQARNLDLAA